MLDDDLFPLPVRTYTVGGVKWLVGDTKAAEDQLQRHGDGICWCFRCLSARAVLAGKVAKAPGGGDEAALVLDSPEKRNTF